MTVYAIIYHGLQLELDRELETVLDSEIIGQDQILW